MTPTKLAQYFALAGQFAGGLGVAAILQPHLTGAQVWGAYITVVLNGLVSLWHALAPSLANTPEDASALKAAANRTGMFILCALILGAVASAQTAPVTTWIYESHFNYNKVTPSVGTQTATTTAASDGFVASAAPIAFRIGGATSLGTEIDQKYDFVDFGAKKTNRVYILGEEIEAPTAGLNIPLGGVEFSPDISTLLNKTNVPAGSLGIYFDGAVGIALPSTGSNSVAFALGGGLHQTLTSSLTWQTIKVQYVHVGARNAAEFSTGLSFAFGPH